MSRWIALHGVAEAGKDTLGAVLVERYGFTKVAFADPLKEMALAIDPIMAIKGFTFLDMETIRLSDIVEARGWDATKKYYPEARRFLQRLATDAIRTQTPDYWCNLGRSRALEIGGKIVFTDNRFTNEADMVKANGGMVVKIATDAEIQDGNANHISERSMIDYDFDLIFDNPRTDNSNELAQRMEHFASLLAGPQVISHPYQGGR